MAITTATVSRELSALHLPSRSLAHGRLCCRMAKTRNSLSSRQASPLTSDPDHEAVDRVSSAPARPAPSVRKIFDEKAIVAVLDCLRDASGGCMVLLVHPAEEVGEQGEVHEGGGGGPRPALGCFLFLCLSFAISLFSSFWRILG